MQHFEDNLHGRSDDPEDLARIIEIQLQRDRARWQRAAEHRRSYRVLALLFFIIIVAGAVAIYFYGVNGIRVPQHRSPGAASSGSKP